MRMPVVLAVAAAAALAACSGGSGKKTPMPPGGGDGGDGGGAHDGGTAAIDPDAPLTDKECDAFIDHTVVIGEMQRVATKGKEVAATPEELAKVQASRRGDPKERSACLQLPRNVWQCAMKAQDPQAFVDCAR
ncbi:MAG TPA: hypothetical protein VL172_08070 [Kofleriaceae bacterium]|nr:hypothetical protein [Kofleriaceae bacterium]